jgi:hypothetical protein|tara:strand:- start:3202 stop:4488 length:1287 start_codon:yes stop_codon:yes gene_type:complete
MNTQTISLSSTSTTDSQTLDTVEMFDTTKVALDISNIYSKTFPTAVDVSWGDGSENLDVDIVILKDYRVDSIIQEIVKGVKPSFLTKCYSHTYLAPSSTLKQTLCAQVNVTYATGDITTFHIPVVMTGEGYYQLIGDMEVVGVELLGDESNSVSMSLISKNSGHIMQMNNLEFNIIRDPVQDPLYIRYIQNDPFQSKLFTDFDNGEFDTGCWMYGLDTTGVGLSGNTYGVQGDSRRCTLIGRNCFIAAHHWGPWPGFQVKFVDGNGDSHIYTVDQKCDTTSLTNRDIRIGTFTEDVSDTLPSYAIGTNIYDDEWLVATRSRRLADTGAYSPPADQRVMLEQIYSFSTTSVSWSTSKFPAEALINYDAAASGDSGDPLFRLNSRGVLEVVSSYLSVGGGPQYGTADTLTAIDQWLTLQGTTRVAQEAQL